jgi:hypothetical protein
VRCSKGQQQLDITRDQIVSRAAEAAFGKPLITNVLRSIIVETFVAAALPDEWDWCAADYAPCDFRHRDGIRLEVKQSAALQSWASAGRVSRSIFDIAPRTGQWLDGGTKWVPGVGRNADIYVFAHHPVTDQSADHCDPMQWNFYVVLASELPERRTISLNGLTRLYTPVDFRMLARAVEQLRQREAVR